MGSVRAHGAVLTGRAYGALSCLRVPGVWRVCTTGALQLAIMERCSRAVMASLTPPRRERMGCSSCRRAFCARRSSGARAALTRARQCVRKGAGSRRIGSARWARLLLPVISLLRTEIALLASVASLKLRGGTSLVVINISLGGRASKGNIRHGRAHSAVITERAFMPRREPVGAAFSEVSGRTRVRAEGPGRAVASSTTCACASLDLQVGAGTVGHVRRAARQRAGSGGGKHVASGS